MSRSILIQAIYFNNKKTQIGLYNPHNSELESSKFAVNTTNINHLMFLWKQIKNRKIKRFIVVFNVSDKTGKSKEKTMNFQDKSELPTFSELIEQINNLNI